MQRYGTQVYKDAIGEDAARKDVLWFLALSLGGAAISGPTLAMIGGGTYAAMSILKSCLQDKVQDFEEEANFKSVEKLMTPKTRKAFLRELTAAKQLVPSPNHDQNHPQHPATQGDRHTTPTTNPTQRPPMGDPVHNTGGAVEDRGRTEVGIEPVATVATPPDTVATETVRPAIGRGFQYQPGAGFVEDGLVLHEEEGDRPYAWFDNLFKEPWHCFIYGSTGNGKSTFVCNILHRLKSLIPDAKIVIIDPKYPYSEWGGFPVTFKGDKQVARGVEAMGQETAKRLEHATKEVDAGRPCPEFPPIIYVLDEANVAYTDYGTMVGDNIKRIVSRGRALNVWGVFIGTSCNVSAYGLQIPDLYNCHRFALKSLAAVAINRDDSLSKPDAARLLQNLKDYRSSPYIARPRETMRLMLSPTIVP